MRWQAVSLPCMMVRTHPKIEPHLTCGASGSRSATSLAARESNASSRLGAVWRLALKFPSLPPCVFSSYRIFSEWRSRFLSLPFQEFLFKSFCNGLSIKVDVEWTHSRQRPDPGRTAMSGSDSGSA